MNELLIKHILESYMRTKDTFREVYAHKKIAYTRHIRYLCTSATWTQTTNPENIGRQSTSTKVIIK